MSRSLAVRVGDRLAHALLGCLYEEIEQRHREPGFQLTGRECRVCGDRVVDVIEVEVTAAGSMDTRCYRIDPETALFGSEIEIDGDGGGSE